MHYLSSAEAHSIDRRVRQHLLWRALLHGTKTFLGAVGIGVLAFLLISAPAQWERVQHFFTGLYEQTRDVFADELNSTEWISPSSFLNEPQFESRPLVEAPAVDANHLVIPAINVNAPILWDIPLEESLNGLQEGVVQAAQSVRPGETGRTFIIGHSAGYWWNKNPWTKVFAVLDQLKAGDLIFLRTDVKTFGYVVSATEVVSPDTVEVVRNASLDHNQLALMTCTPVGTTLNRLVVYAEPVVLE